jgi:quaternary ammonium compound-resistance protein SugE
MTAWWYLIAAGAVEVVMALALKASHDWTELAPSLLGLAAALASIFLLTKALRDLPLGTAYAIWTGIGSAGVVAAGIVMLGESVTAVRLLCLVLVIAGSIGLRLQTT